MPDHHMSEDALHVSAEELLRVGDPLKWIRRSETLRSMKRKRHRQSICDRLLQQRRRQRHACDEPMEGQFCNKHLQRSEPFVYGLPATLRNVPFINASFDAPTPVSLHRDRA